MDKDLLVSGIQVKSNEGVFPFAFFIGALVGGGHNSQPPLGAQLLVVGVLLLLVGVYALFGYGLRRLVRT